MVVERNDSNFKGFDITIKVESIEEAQALYAIFNYLKNVNLIGSENAEKISASIGSKYYVQNNSSFISNGIRKEDYYK